MYEVIAPTLFQNKICLLPGIGVLQLVDHSAEADDVNLRIKSPFQTIDFIPAENTDEKVFNEFSAISELLQKNLDENGEVLLVGIGSFIKKTAGEIGFDPYPVNPIFMPAVDARVIDRRASDQVVLAPGEATTNAAMDEYSSGEIPLNNRWWVWAVALAVFAIALILLHFYQHGFSNGLGNATYIN